jgi:hypothetical protein
MLLFLLFSQQVSAPLGHPQVNHNILFILSYHRYHNGSVVLILQMVNMYLFFTIELLGDLFAIYLG